MKTNEDQYVDSMTSEENKRLLEASGVKKHFAASDSLLDKLLGNQEFVKAVDGVDIAVDDGEIVGVVGESGCGKTTLGRTLARLYEPVEGSIKFEDREIADISGNELQELRKDLQLTYQDPLSSLNPRKTVGEILRRPLSVHGFDDKDKRVTDMLKEIGLKPEDKNRYPHQFSGGQLQRVSIARSLIIEPKLIILDEPVSALDVSIKSQILNMLMDLQDSYDVSYILIAHDLNIVRLICDRVYVMYLGKIVEKGYTEDIFSNPQHPYTRALLKAIPDIDSTTGLNEVDLSGTMPSPLNSPDGCPFSTRCPEYIGEECDNIPPELVPVAESDGTIEPPTSVRVSNKQDQKESSEDHYVSCHWMGEDAAERKQNLEEK